LLNLSSLEDMESKLKKDDDIDELDARRFRANIIGMRFVPVINIV